MIAMHVDSIREQQSVIESTETGDTGYGVRFLLHHLLTAASDLDRAKF